jgi:hypothetical protein
MAEAFKIRLFLFRFLINWKTGRKDPTFVTTQQAALKKWDSKQARDIEKTTTTPAASGATAAPAATADTSTESGPIDPQPPTPRPAAPPAPWPLPRMVVRVITVAREDGRAQKPDGQAHGPAQATFGQLNAGSDDNELPQLATVRVIREGTPPPVAGPSQPRSDRIHVRQPAIPADNQEDSDMVPDLPKK